MTKCADDAEREEVKKILEQSHLKVCYGAQPRLLGPKLNPNDIDEEGRKKAEATLIEAVDEAEYLGAKGIAFLAGKWEEETKDQAYAQLLKTTRNVCDYAAKKGMNVELEVSILTWTRQRSRTGSVCGTVRGRHENDPQQLWPAGGSVPFPDHL